MNKKELELRKAIEAGFLQPILEMPGSDNAFIHELANTFRNTISADFIAIDNSIRTNNIKKVHSSIHKIRSSLEIFAVPGVIKLCSNIENCNDISPISTHYSELKDIVNHYSDLLASELSQVFVKDQKPD